MPSLFDAEEPANTVPFGRYKGRPVQDMLADADYMAWLEAQPWFREKFGRLTAQRDAAAASRTPVHNKLQTLFLSEAYQRAFCEVAAPDVLERCREGVARAIQVEIQRVEWKRVDAAKSAAGFDATAEEYARKAAAGEKNPYGKGWAEMAEEYRERAGKSRAKAMEIEAWQNWYRNADKVITTRVAFESNGADVRIIVVCTGPETDGEKTVRSLDVTIEIKPTVADEYPAVLRQMGRNGSRYLFLNEYQGEGATEEQFRAIFAASGIKVVFKRDVDAKAAEIAAG